MFGLTGIFGIVAGILSFSAYLFYIVAIVKGTTKPSRSTWFILAFAGIITVIAYDAAGAGDTIWVAVSNAAASIIIALLSIKYGVGGKSKLDIFCFIGSIVSLGLWWVFGSPIATLVGELAVDTFGLLPTIKKVWINPEQEDRPAWTMTLTANVLNLFAINSFQFGVMIYPIYFFIIDLCVTFPLYYIPLFKKKNQN